MTETAAPRLRVLTLSWYAPDRMDAGELIRFGRLLARPRESADVRSLVVDRETIESQGGTHIVPPVAGRSYGYRVRSLDYAIATLRGQAIESYRLGHSARLRSWVASEIAAFQPDVVWANQPFVWDLIPKEWKRKAILDTHNVNSDRLRRIAESTSNRSGRVVARIQTFLTARFERRYVAEASVTLVVSPEDRDSLLAKSPGAAVLVLANGVEPDHGAKRSIAAVGAPRKLLFLGSLGYSANISALERVAAWLEEVPGAVTVTVAGSGDPRRAMEICAGNPAFRFVGRLKSVRPALRDHHALIAPHSQGGGSRIKVLEAFGHRLPVIGTAVAVEGTGARPNVHYFRAEDGRGFSHALEALADRSAEDVVEAAWDLALAATWSSLSEDALEAIVRVREEPTRAGLADAG